MASPTTDNIRVAIRVRPLIKRENDFHSTTHWKVDKNTITQVNSNGKMMSNSSYIFDRIFDISNSTQDVYDEFGRPTVLSAMEGFNGTLFAYGQTSSGKTYTMMGDQKNEGVIPKAVGEIFDYIEKHPSREFLIRVSYMEIYNEDIKDLLNPTKTNLKVHENTQRQVYVGELTEEIVSCPEDVFKHMLRGEKNRHFGETNMNDRSSRSHTIFRVVIESREMMDESRDSDSSESDGAVRVAHMNLVDLAGSERASQTGAFGQRLKEGGHINKSLLALGSVIAKLSEGESFIPFRDSKLTRILQSSLGGNAKTSMICTITPAAVEETISTLKFASRAKTIKNCPEVNEVLDDGTLLKRYRKEICELKKQLVEMSQQSTISQMQELQIEKEKMVEMLEQQRIQQSEQEEKIKRLRNMICSAGKETETKGNKLKLAKRRETWCPGAALSKAPLASAAAVQARLQRIGSSPSSDGSEFDEIPKEAFFSRLDEEEERKSTEFSKKRVGFVSPRTKRCLSPVMDIEHEDKDMQTEPDEKIVELQNEVKKLRKNLVEAVQTRDLYEELLEQNNAVLEKMSSENGSYPAPTNSDKTLKYVTEMRNEKAVLESEVEVLRTQCQDLRQLKARNKELEDQIQSLENERTLSNEYIAELQAEHDSIQAEKQALVSRVEGLENTGAFNTAATMERDALEMALRESELEKQQLQENLESWKENYAGLEGEVTRLQHELACAVEEKDTEALVSAAKMEVSSLQMALEGSGLEKHKLQENLVSWKEKYAGLEEEVTRLQHELACAADEKDTEALVSASKMEVSSLQMALEESGLEKQRLKENLESWKEKFACLEKNVAQLQDELTREAAEKIQWEERVICVNEEASVKTKELEDEIKRMAERLSSADEQERMLTEVIEQKLQLEESIELLKAEHQKVISEEKCDIEARFEQYNAEKENEIAQLVKELEDAQQQLTEKSCGVEEMVAQVIAEKRDIEEKFDKFKADKDVELDKLNQEMEALRGELKLKLIYVEEKESILSEAEKRKCEAEETLDEFKSIRDDEVANLNQEVEKIRAELQEKLCNVEEKENMLTEVIQQKCELEEKFEIFKEDKERKTTQLIHELEQLRNETQTKGQNADEKEGLLNELSQQKRAVEESFSVFKQEKESEIAKLMEEIELLQSNLNNSTLSLEEKEKLSNEVVLQKCEFDAFKLEKENEVQKLSEGLRELEVQLREKTSTVEEKENLLNEMMQLKFEAEEELKTLKQEKESEIEKLTHQLQKNVTGEDDCKKTLDTEDKQSNLKVELEKTIDEKKEVEQMLDRVKKERDAIKNDLSESITDTAELQRDVFDMQQKVKRYKEHIFELESELEQRAVAISTSEEKIQELQNQLSQRNEHPSAENNDELNIRDQSEGSAAQEIREECEALKSSLERVEQANEGLENEAQKLRHETDELRGKLSDLEKQLVESEQACTISEQRLQGEQEKCEKLVKELEDHKSSDCFSCKDLEKQLAEIKEAGHVTEKQLEEERAKYKKVEAELEQIQLSVCSTRNRSGNVPFEVELQRAKNESEELLKELTVERKAHEMLRKEHSSLAEELQHLRDSLLRDTNRGMDQQRVIDKMKAERRETICVQAHQRQELEKDLTEAEKKVSELESHCTLLKSEKDLLEHRLELANKKVEETKQEMRDMENLYSSHNSRGVTQIDESKALQKLKQMEFSLDLTKQKCEKAEARVKELENENRQLRGADIRNGALSEERDNLKQQVQQGKQALVEKSKKLNEFSIEVTQLRAHVDKLSEESKKNRSSLEKKENKIDNLEQKLWETEEELKLERQRFQEQQSQAPILDELNSTIRVKHEELEHMTFLVDEREIEIAEVRSSLQEKEIKQQKMVEALRQKEERLDELENELEHANKNILEARTGQDEAEAKIEELKAIIKQQESEIISMKDTVDSEKAESEIQSQELGLKTQRLENEMQDLEHKLLEVESELEFIKNSCEEATADKQELVEILRGYDEAFNGSSSATHGNVDVGYFKAQLGSHIGKMSSVLKTSSEVEDINNKLDEALESRRMLEEKLGELQTSFQGQKSALEEEIDELRESVLNEKKLVFELEDKVNFAENGKSAMEAELRRVLEEKETSLGKEDVEELVEAKEKIVQLEYEIQILTEDKHKWESIVNSETELRRELETQKEINVQFEDEARRLKEEVGKWESLSETKSAALEEKRKSWEENMAGVTQRYEEERQQLMEQLREISTLKVKESEDIYSEKEEKIVELESKLATVTKTTAEYERALEHYQLKLAKVEYERDTIVERLEKQSSTTLVDNSEIETLKKECETAKRKCKDAQEKYFSESDRLKAIIDEQEDEMDALKAELKKMTEASQNIAGPTDNSEIEALRKECEVAKKKCKDAQEKYFSESDRLTAIIDEQQDEQEEFVRQMNELKAKTAEKDAEMCKMRNELDETKKKISQADLNSTSSSENSEMERLKKECEVAKRKCKDAQEKYFSESDRLKAIIDEQQDEQEEFVRQMNERKEETAKKDAEMCKMRNELDELKKNAQAATAQNSACLMKECEALRKKAKEVEEKYSSEANKLKAIINKQREIIDKSQSKQDTEEEAEATRIDLAQKNMQIQSLQYDLYKLQEKYDKDTHALSKEVEWGREKVGSLKLEIRRMKEPESEDTISLLRGQPVAAKKKDDSDVGVVSNVAIYSLKAKVGKLENETERLNEKVQQLEKEKATLSLMNTESSNKVAQLTSENKALKTHKKKLVEEAQKLKANDFKLKGDCGRRLPEVSTETLERESRNSSILNLSTVENVNVSPTEYKRRKPESKKENFQNWLSEDAANNMFKDEPNQCANQ